MMTYSKESYRFLLRRALELEYTFAGFGDGAQAGGRRIYLRHDVDYSLRMAVELAEINRSVGVQGTFCLLLRSQIYNLLSPWGLEQVRTIRALGQRVAFHYVAPAVLPAGDADLAALIRADFEIVRHHVPDIEPAFSWHNPTAETMNRGLRLNVPGLANLSSAEFTQQISYYSDSNLRHAVADFEKLLRGKENRAMHWLLHPLNWVAGGSTMLDVLATTWKYVIREREEEMRLNRHYAEGLPGGMPDRVLKGFSDQWLQAALGRSK